MLLLIRRLFRQKIKLSDLVRTKSRVSYPRNSPLVYRRLQRGMLILQRDGHYGKAE